MKRVSLAEQLFITPAFMLVLCWQYWLWSRTDWKPEYAHTKWQLIPLFLLVILVWRGLLQSGILPAACDCLCRGYSLPRRADKCSEYGLDDTGCVVCHEHFKNDLIRAFR